MYMAMLIYRNTIDEKVLTKKEKNRHNTHRMRKYKVMTEKYSDS